MKRRWISGMKNANDRFCLTRVLCSRHACVCAKSLQLCPTFATPWTIKVLSFMSKPCEGHAAPRAILPNGDGAQVTSILYG